MALERIVEAILRNENSVLTVSTRADGFYGLSDVCLSLPTVVNHDGVERVIEAALSDEEIARLHASGAGAEGRDCRGRESRDGGSREQIAPRRPLAPRATRGRCRAAASPRWSGRHSRSSASSCKDSRSMAVCRSRCRAAGGAGAQATAKSPVHAFLPLLLGAVFLAMIAYSVRNEQAPAGRRWPRVQSAAAGPSRLRARADSGGDAVCGRAGCADDGPGAARDVVCLGASRALCRVVLHFRLRARDSRGRGGVGSLAKRASGPSRNWDRNPVVRRENRRHEPEQSHPPHSDAPADGVRFSGAPAQSLGAEQGRGYRADLRVLPGRVHHHPGLPRGARQVRAFDEPGHQDAGPQVRRAPVPRGGEAAAVRD